MSPRPPWVDAYKGAKAAPAQVIVVDQLFPTPPPLARRMVALADIRPEHFVLEPSAGTGNLLRAIGRRTFLQAVEKEASLAAELSKTWITRCADFLSLDAAELGWFDRVVMNPPFANGQDVKHILHALTFLKPHGRLVALCAAGSRQEKALRPRTTTSTWETIEGAFKDAGTGVRVTMLSIEAT